MERIEIVQQVGNYFPDTKIADALRFAGDIDRGFNRKIEDARYKAEDAKYAYGQEQYDAGVKAGKESVRTTFEPVVVEATTWAIMNFTERDHTRKIQCIKMLRDKFRPLGLLEGKTIVDMITPMGKTDQLDWAKIEEAEARWTTRKAEPVAKTVSGLADWEKELLNGDKPLATDSALTALREKLTTNEAALNEMDNQSDSYDESYQRCGCGCED